MTLYPLSLIGGLLKSLIGFSSTPVSADPPVSPPALDEPPRSSVGVSKPEFLQLRDQLIEEGEGPADIVFGPDLFDPRISEAYAPYTDALLELKGRDGAIEARQSVSTLFKTRDEREIQERMREYLSQVKALREQNLRNEGR